MDYYSDESTNSFFQLLLSVLRQACEAIRDALSYLWPSSPYYFFVTSEKGQSMSILEQKWNDSNRRDKLSCLFNLNACVAFIDVRRGAKCGVIKSSEETLILL